MSQTTDRLPGPDGAAPAATPMMSDDPLVQFLRQLFQQQQTAATMPQAAPPPAPVAPPAPAAPPAAPAPGAPPMHPPQHPPQPQQHQRDDSDAIHYLKLQLGQLQQGLADMQKQREAERLDYAREKARRQVDHLIHEGYWIPDPAKEVERMAKMADADRNERAEEIRTCYQRAPLGDPVPVRDDVPARGPRQDAAEQEAAFQYLRDHPDCDDYDAALAAVRAAAAK